MFKKFLIGTLYHLVQKFVCVAKIIVLLLQIDARLAYNTGDCVFKLTRLTFELSANNFYAKMKSGLDNCDLECFEMSYLQKHAWLSLDPMSVGTKP